MVVVSKTLPFWSKEEKMANNNEMVRLAKEGQIKVHKRILDIANQEYNGDITHALLGKLSSICPDLNQESAKELAKEITTFCKEHNIS
jgi:hypothetical protein